MLWAPVSELFCSIATGVGKVLGDIWSSEWLSAYQVKSYLVREYPHLKNHHEETGVDIRGWGMGIEGKMTGYENECFQIQRSSEQLEELSIYQALSSLFSVPQQARVQN